MMSKPLIEMSWRELVVYYSIGFAIFMVMFAALLGLLCWTKGGIPERHIVMVPVPVTTCQEDMPCWDCHTMGNRICGLDLDP